MWLMQKKSLCIHVHAGVHVCGVPHGSRPIRPDVYLSGFKDWGADWPRQIGKRLDGNGTPSNMEGCDSEYTQAPILQNARCKMGVIKKG